MEGFDHDVWLRRFAAAGGRIKVNGISMRLHPDCKVVEACRTMWSELRGERNLSRWAAVEDEVCRQTGAVASWVEWPARAVA